MNPARDEQWESHATGEVAIAKVGQGIERPRRMLCWHARLTERANTETWRIIMGLAERRKIKELQDTTFPERTAELAEITGGSNDYIK